MHGMASSPPGSRPWGTPPIRDAEKELRDLIHRAFKAARLSGRDNWDQMTVAVLKNRLLDLTDRAFDEGDYGARSVTDLVRRLPDLLAVDEETVPPRVRLVQTARTGSSPPTDDGSKVREDLWNATVDYRSQTSYLWDGSRARRVEELDPNEQRRYPELPTITETQMDEWRTGFMAEDSRLIESDDRIRDDAEYWRRHRLGTGSLPNVLRRRWNAYLKRSVVAHLKSWFQAQSIPVPPDLLVGPRQPAAGIPAADESAEVRELRDLVLRCVRVMTEEELRALPLPAAAVVRARR